MKKSGQLVDRVDQGFAWVAEWVFRWRWLVMVMALILVGGGLYFAARATPDNSLDAYFDKTDPAYVAYMDYMADFNSDEITYILYSIPDSDYGPFDLEGMRKIADLTEALEREVPFAREVTSLANVEFIRADGDDIIVDELLIDFPETQAELLALRDALLAKPLYVDYLIDRTGQYGAVIIDMTKSSTDVLDDIIYDPEGGEGLFNLYPQVSDVAVREILERPEYEGIDFYLTGDAPMNSAYNQIFTTDSGYIMIATLVIAALLALVLFRATWVGLLGPVSVVIMSVILTMGFIGMVGWKVGLFFAMVPALLCAVGIAQSVHILLEYQRALSVSGDRPSATRAALKKVGGPCLMAALTTAAGFLVMSVSELKALAELAVYAAAGVMMTFALSITLLLVFLSGRKGGKPVKNARAMAVHPGVIRLVKAVVSLDLRHPRWVIAGGLVVLTLGLIGVSKLRIDFNFLDEFKDHVEWKQHSVKAEEVMGGLLNVTYIIDTGRPEGVKDPAVIAAIEKVQHFAEQQPLVVKTFSMADMVKDLNRSFHGDDDAFYTLPQSRELLAQYLLVYEVSGGKELWDLVSLDFSKTVLEMRVGITDATKIKALIGDIDRYLAENPIPGADVRQTGIGLLWVKICEYIASTQMTSYSLVFVIVAIFMCLSFGSVKVGLLSMIPNLAPVIVVLGYMGWTDTPLDYMKLLLATIAIGIAVDDTIHLVTRYRKRFLEMGDYRLSLDAAMHDVGPALIITSLILVFGFSSFLFSN
ncbi:MAG: RND transporter, partial [Porticoccaceae bacterium]|nr:RND transporter [Porticoccaceae bacterium]